MSAMTTMSRAIRHTIEDYGRTLGDLSDDVLVEFTEITGGFYLDLKDELERRRQAADGEDAQATEGER